mmetsp:Transcript_86768/g.245662  ORF Transcript_86768/g.245662 Transcript_86768/m.245662 type:complete len:320 (+) Transcript_86768:5069-6028(+)
MLARPPPSLESSPISCSGVGCCSCTSGWFSTPSRRAVSLNRTDARRREATSRHRTRNPPSNPNAVVTFAAPLDERIACAPSPASGAVSPTAPGAEPGLEPPLVPSGRSTAAIRDTRRLSSAGSRRATLDLVSADSSASELTSRDSTVCSSASPTSSTVTVPLNTSLVSTSKSLSAMRSSSSTLIASESTFRNIRSIRWNSSRVIPISASMSRGASSPPEVAGRLPGEPGAPHVFEDGAGVVRPMAPRPRFRRLPWRELRPSDELSWALARIAAVRRSSCLSRVSSLSIRSRIFSLCFAAAWDRSVFLAGVYPGIRLLSD